MSPADRSSADAAGAGTLVFELPNDIAAIEGAVDHAVEHCAPAGLDRRRLLFNFRVGLTEAISNAILFGNSGDPDTRVRVELRAVPGEVRVRVSDQGDGFDPEAVPDPRLPENLLLPDGRGVFLMRALMDEVRFNRRGNEVTLVLREPPATTPPEVGLAQPVAETLEDFGIRLGLELRAWEVVGGRRVPVHRFGGGGPAISGGHRFHVPLGPGRVLEVEVAGQGVGNPLVGVLRASLERAAPLAGEVGRNRAALEAALEANRAIREDMAREQLSREMELAHDLQMKLLPPIPRVPRVEAAARVMSATSVGGDFYQVIQLSGGRVGVMIGDVSGHGFPAALIMALVMSAAAIYAEQGAAPATVLEYVDRAIGDELESTEMYLSLCYCVLSPGTPEIAYSNAGHPHAFVVESDGTARRLFATDPPMGIGKPPYGQSAADWSPGEDILLLFTDGLSDTLAHAGRSSGEDLVLSTVAARHGRRADEILHALFELCRRATPSIPSDDRTAVILRTR
ncbi:MAG: SpoIIE family protein phosphatase [Gemmatimonadota bacterium]|nr:SpoIIE family protein phosphatase [Gemmatimonadota bacterium]